MNLISMLAFCLITGGGVMFLKADAPSQQIIYIMIIQCGLLLFIARFLGVIVYAIKKARK